MIALVILEYCVSQCCREGDPFQGPKPGSGLTLGNEILIRTSCYKTTQANGYYGAWPGWAVSISVHLLTKVVKQSIDEEEKEYST